MNKQYISPRGTQDVFGEEVRKWQQIEKLAREICERFHVQEMRTPMYEHTEVFKRENDASDVVNKEMYTFVIKNREGESPSLTLRPEGTAGLIRAYVQNKLYATGGSLQKFFYIAPNFRYERPQKGRMRIHHQFAVEFIGASNPMVDVEAMSVGLTLLEELGITKFKLLVNTIGDAESQENYKMALRDHFKPYLPELCADCNRRYEQNPLRMLDCKVDHDHEAIKNAPSNYDYLNEESKAYFESLKELLDIQGIAYELDNRLVRGLDYYHHTVFEVISTDENVGAQSTIFGGGRYNHLVDYFGGPETGAVGFGMGIERLLILADASGVKFDTEDHVDVFGMPMGSASNNAVFALIQKLRREGISADMDVENKSFKAQFKMVDRFNAKIAVLCGDDELEKGQFTIKNIATQEQVTLKENEALVQIKEWLGA
ncbi:histidine--tRNA ligase [Erysipelothrix sp. HDW6C]|uniref:histidine--tRNA ligase n=1 Tax=Erysipelothrix sp. HDW6C TaxID=2714930 RepID=UPI00140834F0|nr:histidine--tRNA ligase [Erysipelothrix sp. HDW6C]QIK70360.1 histidine--tRNA ligase [Erysipelothrix sp. HDW6C]